MADVAEVDDQAQEKKSKLPVIVAVLTSLLGAAGGYLTVNMGLLGSSETSKPQTKMQNRTAPSSLVQDLAFVQLDPIIISFSQGNERRLLRFVGNLEVVPYAAGEVEILKPRIVDILNGYLRALKIEDLEEPAALYKIRSQLLHRVRIVAGEDRINDLLIIEFVLN